MTSQPSATAARRPGTRLRAMLRDTRGSTSMEFSLLAIPLFLFVIGILVVGINLMAMAMLNATTKAVGRQIQIGNIRGTSDASVRTYVCDRMGVLVPACSTTLQIYAASGATFGVVPAATATQTKLSPTGFSPGVAGSSVLLQIAYVNPLGLSLAKITSFMLASTTVFKNEP